MKQSVERRTCDECGKVAEYVAQAFGCTPFAAWISASMRQGEALGPWDFCCQECCAAFFSGTPVSERKGTKKDLTRKQHATCIEDSHIQGR